MKKIFILILTFSIFFSSIPVFAVDYFDAYYTDDPLLNDFKKNSNVYFFYPYIGRDNKYYGYIHWGTNEGEMALAYNQSTGAISPCLIIENNGVYSCRTDFRSNSSGLGDWRYIASSNYQWSGSSSTPAWVSSGVSIDHIYEGRIFLVDDFPIYAASNIASYLNGNENSGVTEPAPPAPPEFNGINGTSWKDINIVDKIFYGLFGDWWVSGTTSYNEYLNAREVLLRSEFNDRYGSEGDELYAQYVACKEIEENGQKRWLFWSIPIAQYFGMDFTSRSSPAGTTVTINDDIYTNEEFTVDDDITYIVRPVVYDHDNNKYITGDWRSYTTVGNTIVNRYNQTVQNNVIYTTDVQSQKQYAFDLNIPVNSTGVLDVYPPAESTTVVNHVYNYYTTYNSPNNNDITNVTNNYFSYPAADLIPDPDVDPILDEATPQNIFGFLKKFMKNLLKFFKMLIKALSFLPPWASNILTTGVTILVVLIVGIIIVKGVL